MELKFISRLLLNKLDKNCLSSFLSVMINSRLSTATNGRCYCEQCNFEPWTYE